jgi:hypothetical protein
MPCREKDRIPFYGFKDVSHQIINIAHREVVFSRAFHPRMRPRCSGDSRPSRSPNNFDLNYRRAIMAWVAQFLETIEE